MPCIGSALKNAVAGPGRATMRERSKGRDTNADEAAGHFRCTAEY